MYVIKFTCHDFLLRSISYRSFADHDFIITAEVLFFHYLSAKAFSHP